MDTDIFLKYGFHFPVLVSIRITILTVFVGFVVPVLQSRPAVPVEVCDMRIFPVGVFVRFIQTKY